MESTRWSEAWPLLPGRFGTGLCGSLEIAKLGAARARLNADAELGVGIRARSVALEPWMIQGTYRLQNCLTYMQSIAETAGEAIIWRTDS